MISHILKFGGRTILFMTALYWLHTPVVDQMGFTVIAELLWSCYLFNTLLALGFFMFLLLVSKTNPDQLGWVFLLTSALKLLLFWALIQPRFQNIEATPLLLFSTFFIPYAIALTLEIFHLVKILNQGS